MPENLLMDKNKSQLIKKAQKIWGQIHPCFNKLSLEECFTVIKGGKLVLWFNTEDNSTHMVADDNVTVYDTLTLDKVQLKSK